MSCGLNVKQDRLDLAFGLVSKLQNDEVPFNNHGTDGLPACSTRRFSLSATVLRGALQRSIDATLKSQAPLSQMSSAEVGRLRPVGLNAV